jgi:hypothetical protein
MNLHAPGSVTGANVYKPTTFMRLIGTIAAVQLVTGCAAQAQPRVNADAQVLQDFNDRIKNYMKLHDQSKRGAPKLKETTEPAEINAAEKVLGDRIRAARKTATEGEIFTPAIRAKFRQLLNPELKGADGAETKAAIKEDAPAPGTVPLKVNATYPDKAPLPTMPPNILANLPKLPEDLEYRIVGRNLILRDVPANLIVDFIPNLIR